VIIKDLYKKILTLTQKLKRLKKHHIFGLIIIIIGVGLSIVPFIFVPLLNTERIWKSQLCMIEPWLCGDSFTLPQNCLIQNKYDVIVFNAEDGYRSRSISFTYSATGTTYTFNYYLSIEMNFGNMDLFQKILSGLFILGLLLSQW